VAGFDRFAVLGLVGGLVVQAPPAAHENGKRNVTAQHY
jgi:hypothetical protein